jgi:ATP-dependent Lon protease
MNGDQTQTSPAAELPADAMIILPVRNMVLFPGIVLPFVIGRPRSVAAAQEAARSERPLGVLVQRDASVEDPTSADLHTIGTVAAVMRYVTAPDGSHHVVCQGERRFRVIEFLDGYPFLVARVEQIGESELRTAEVEARVHRLKERAVEAVQLLPQAPGELAGAIQSIQSASALADFVAAFLDLQPEEKQQVLETLDVQARLDMVLERLSYRIGVLKLSQQIGQQTKDTLEARQREHLLREQLRQIQKELGEEDERAAEIAELKEAIEKAGMPDEVRQQTDKELRRLERMPEAAAEYGMTRTYLDWLIGLPWKIEAEPEIDIAEARRILDEDHYGLDKIKRRILEWLAVRKLAPHGRSPILCFVARPASARRRSASRSRGPRAASSRASRSAACTTSRRSAATGAPISARCRATSSRRSARSAPATASSCWTRWTSWAAAIRATPPPHCLKCSTRSRTPPSATPISGCPSTCRR